MKPLIPTALLTASLLAACSSNPVTPVTQAARPAFVSAVQVTASDTPASVAQRLGGTILSWPTDCTGSCTALVGLAERPTATLGAQSAGTVEANRDVFSGGGSMTAVMGGSRSYIFGDSQTPWSSSGEHAIPENGPLWQKIGLEQAHSMAPKLGAGVTVAVIDSGIDLTHPAFQSSLTASGTWKDFYGADDLPQEEGEIGVGAYGHGTNVAGIVMQIAPAAKILPLRVLGPDGSGDVAGVAQAILYAADQGAKVINLSLGSLQNSTIVEDVIRQVTARGVYVVASAGNANQNSISYPAALATKKGSFGEYLLSVGSTDLSDLKSSFSNYARSLEIVGPGENVYAPYPDGMVAAWSGTSMAAPMMAGGLALALGQGLKVSGKDLTKKMAESAFDVYNNGANETYKDMLGVKGRVDLVEFLKDTTQQ
ncbi:S8 family serine peptidase [Deinococcus sp. 6GRE01]|uniref:S8 family serine peptidase n=1 Tax=Deinococcus sp. 6GRE01 TaxID=2745873 RepID=UPI001E5766B8|nr:S8 family serine peptidase [Deinococcus sp. 6GRE01]MCD0158412.1 S8 family serine peptidase [Deinococcus sp. 6GRE01]